MDEAIYHYEDNMVNGGNFSVGDFVNSVDLVLAVNRDRSGSVDSILTCEWSLEIPGRQYLYAGFVEHLAGTIDQTLTFHPLKHSPEDYSWGYNKGGSSGSIYLASAILDHAMGAYPEAALAGRFAGEWFGGDFEDRIGGVGMPFAISSEWIQIWLKTKPLERHETIDIEDAK